jgi:hypothetical protein
VSQPHRRDPPNCRQDLIVKAAQAGSHFRSAFDWINDKEALRAQNNPANRGLQAPQIRQLAEDWILQGKPITCVPEVREGYRDERHFHYDIIIEDLPDFPSGLYVEMDLVNCEEDDPTARVLSAHPPSF